MFEKFFIEKSERCAFEVEVSKPTRGYGRIDFLSKRNDIYTGIEIKVSVSDFNSKHGHNLFFHKNYYATTPEVYNKIKERIPDNVGVYILELKNGVYEMNVVKKCKKVDMTAKNINRIDKNMVTALCSTIHRLTEDYRFVEGYLQSKDSSSAAPDDIGKL